MTGILQVILAAGPGRLIPTAAPDEVSGAAGTSTVVSDPTTVTQTGGFPPYTYFWVKELGDAITASSPTSATTVFEASGMLSPETRTAQFYCEVSDASGQTISSNIVDVTLIRT